MDDTIARLVERIRKLQAELDAELKTLQTRFRYSLEGRKVRFEQDIAAYHKEFRTGLIKFLREAKSSSILTAPVIYAMLVPLVIVDLFATVYQHICFRAYDMARVRRADYVVIDRQHLAYLNAIEKLNCAYCGYANGVIAYAREIVARTEQYWCPIRHARPVKGSHERYLDFIEYGDADALLEGWERNREKARKG